MSKPRADVQALPDRHLVCRDLRHAWRHHEYEVLTRRRNGDPSRVVRVVRCTRCTAEREDEYRFPYWERLRTTYRYPDGYLLTGAGKPPKVGEIRTEVFRRLEGGGYG